MAVQRGYLDFLDFNLEFDVLSRNWAAPKGNQVLEMYRSGYTRLYVDQYGGEVCLPQDVYVDIQRKTYRQGIQTINKFLSDAEKIAKTGDLGRVAEFMRKDDMVLLLPGVVSAYALQHRLWAKLDVDLLKPVSQESRWDDLVLPRGHRELVEALVEAHPREDALPFDAGSKRDESQGTETNLLGKGKGCVVLLHGPPGLGKTSIAECVAASAKRPLFHLTCGELGGRIVDVDRGLEDLFDLAHKWGCVLLLEEADAFVQKRSPDSLHRNALVSVFLRVLEHYSGILFVTATRGITIDDAFRSRCNLALSFPPLTLTRSLQVWSLNLRRLEALSARRARSGKPPVAIQREDIMVFAHQSYRTARWNARQIRNAFQTALALAESKARKVEGSEVVVGKGEFLAVADSLAAFDAYLAQPDDAPYQDEGEESDCRAWLQD